MKSIWKRAALISVGAVFLTAAGVAYLRLTELVPGFGLPCIWNMCTGLYCPGCGGTRAARALLHLDIAKAFHYNAAFVVLLPGIAAYFGALAYSYIRYGRDAITRKVPSRLLWCVLAAVLLFGVLRNLPWFAFLAPQI